MLRVLARTSTPRSLPWVCLFFVLLRAATGAVQQQQQEALPSGRPYLLPLRREAVPVIRGGRTVTHKSAYSGTVLIGGPKPQEFSVVFDTGSGHLVVPSVECRSETCLAHRRYNISASETALAINSNGEPVPPDELCDQVTIGFGTGTVKGEFAREMVCAGAGAICSSMTVVMAVEMSELPFKSFSFDGLFGLGLGSLVLAPEFSFFGRLASGAGSGRPIRPRFGIFLTDETGGEQSEIAFGGHNDERLMEPLRWAPVALPELGYWQVEIRAIRIGSAELGACRSGGCRAVLDTGTSHLGVPSQHIASIIELLSAVVPPSGVGGKPDCRHANAPMISIELGNFSLVLGSEDYMRPEPVPQQLLAQQEAGGGEICRPRLMPVNLKAPLGPDLFILGEPFLHRYYTVYDWQTQRIGFGAAARGPKKTSAPADEALKPALEAFEEEVQKDQQDRIYLVQVSLTVIL